MFWMPDQVLHDASATFYGIIISVVSKNRFRKLNM